MTSPIPGVHQFGPALLRPSGAKPEKEPVATLPEGLAGGQDPEVAATPDEADAVKAKAEPKPEPEKPARKS